MTSERERCAFCQIVDFQNCEHDDDWYFERLKTQLETHIYIAHRHQVEFVWQVCPQCLTWAREIKLTGKLERSST